MEATMWTGPEVGTYVTLDEATWLIASREGNELTLTRRSVAPGTSYGRIMGNGRCPDYGVYRLRFVLTADNFGDRVGEPTFDLENA